MTASLPALASLEQLRRQAKDLVKRFKARDADALHLVRAYLPRAADMPVENVPDVRLTLSEAQLIIARRYGYPSWPRLKRRLETAPPDHGAAIDAFVQAAQQSDVARVRTLLRKHPALKDQIDAPLFGFDSPAIVMAAGRRDRNMVELLLENRADIHARSKWWAGGFGVLPNSDPGFAAYLIERGAMVDVWTAASMNQLERLEELIRADPEIVNARGGDGQGPLHYAASVEAAAMLLDNGAQIDMRDIDHGGTPAQTLVTERPEVCRYLLSRGAELDIFMAVQLGDLNLVREALAADPDCLNARVGHGKLTAGSSDGGHIYLYKLRNCHSPLYLAAELGHDDIYRFLLARSLPEERLLAAFLASDEATIREVIAQHPNIVTTLPPDRMRAIADAAWHHKTDAVRLMLQFGFDIEARGDGDSTALNRAAVRGYADLIGLLLEHGASLEARNAYGGRPLSACLWGAENFRDPNGDYPASVERLIAAGAPLADIRYPSRDKLVNARLRKYLRKAADTSLIAAIKLGSLECSTRLLDRDPDLANRPESGMLPLLQAVRSNQPEIVRLLLDHGADPSLKETPDGPTPLAEANAAAQHEITDMLRRAASARPMPRT